MDIDCFNAVSVALANDYTLQRQPYPRFFCDTGGLVDGRERISNFLKDFISDDSLGGLAPEIE